MVGKMRNIILIVVLTVGVIILALIFFYQKNANIQKELFLYCGAGLRLPINESIEVFSKEHGVNIQANYAGSGALLNQLQTTKKGDLYMPGDVSYIELIEPKGLVEFKQTVCYFVPVILVRKGNPNNINDISDLLKPGVKLGLGDPEVAAIGKISKQIFEKNNIDMEAVKENLVFNSATVDELGIQIKVGKVDAVIVWDSTAFNYVDSGDIVRISSEKNIISTVAIALLKNSKNKEASMEFINFLTSEQGQEIFKRNGFSTELPE